MCYRSGTGVRCWIGARQVSLGVHSLGIAALFCVKWRHGRHLESVTSNRKSNFVNRCISLFVWGTFCQISSRSDLKRRGLRRTKRRITIRCIISLIGIKLLSWFGLLVSLSFNLYIHCEMHPCFQCIVLYCIVFLYSLEVCNLSKRDLQSLDFTVNRFFYEIILYKRYVCC